MPENTTEGLALEPSLYIRLSVLIELEPIKSVTCWRLGTPAGVVAVATAVMVVLFIDNPLRVVGWRAARVEMVADAAVRLVTVRLV